MPFQVTAARPHPRIRCEHPGAYIPKLKLSELQLAILSKKSVQAPTAPTAPPSGPPLPPPADLNEPRINRGPLWSPLYRKASACGSASASDSAAAAAPGSSTEMRPTALLAAGPRTPLIKFLGKRSAPKSIDHAPHAHPASPSHSLPDSFASYRSKAQQHGPLGGQGSAPAKASPGPVPGAGGPTAPRVGRALGRIGGKSGAELGPVQPAAGEFFDRSELPRRFRKLEWTEEEIEAVNSGGATSIKSQLSYNFKL